MLFVPSCSGRLTASTSLVSGAAQTARTIGRGPPTEYEPLPDLARSWSNTESQSLVETSKSALRVEGQLRRDPSAES